MRRLLPSFIWMFDYALRMRAAWLAREKKSECVLLCNVSSEPVFIIFILYLLFTVSNLCR